MLKAYIRAWSPGRGFFGQYHDEAGARALDGVLYSRIVEVEPGCDLYDVADKLREELLIAHPECVNWSKTFICIND